MHAFRHPYIPYKHAYKHAYMHAYIHAYIHTYMHTYIHTYIHTYTHTHIPSPTSQTPHHQATAGEGRNHKKQAWPPITNIPNTPPPQATGGEP